MPYLGDYLGQVLGEVAVARMMMDAETLRVAELYAGHPLLQHLPVPRFRLPTLKINMPVAVKDIPLTRQTTDRKKAMETIKKQTFESYSARLEKLGITLTTQQKALLKTRLAEPFDNLSIDESLPLPASQLTEKLARTFEELASEKMSDEPEGPAKIKSASRALRADLMNSFLKELRSAGRVEVMGAISEIQAVGPATLLTRIEIHLCEESVEWKVVESEGESESRLVPE